MLTDIANLRQHDTSVAPGTAVCRTYDITGASLATTVNGVTTTVGTNSSTNFAAPSSITAAAATSNLSWTSFLGMILGTGPNGDTAFASYDTNAHSPNRTRESTCLI